MCDSPKVYKVQNKSPSGYQTIPEGSKFSMTPHLRRPEIRKRHFWMGELWGAKTKQNPKSYIPKWWFAQTCQRPRSETARTTTCVSLARQLNHASKIPNSQLCACTSYSLHGFLSTLFTREAKALRINFSKSRPFPWPHGGCTTYHECWGSGHPRLGIFSSARKFPPSDKSLTYRNTPNLLTHSLTQ